MPSLYQKPVFPSKIKFLGAVYKLTPVFASTAENLFFLRILQLVFNMQAGALLTTLVVTSHNENREAKQACCTQRFMLVTPWCGRHSRNIGDINSQLALVLTFASFLEAEIGKRYITAVPSVGVSVGLRSFSLSKRGGATCCNLQKQLCRYTETGILFVFVVYGNVE